MKVLFFSDVHGSAESVGCLKKRIDDFSPELLVLLGDVLYQGACDPFRRNDVQNVAKLLNSFAEKIIAVRGNCDSVGDQMLLDFPIMADFSSLYADDVRFFLTHGHLWNESNLPPLPKNAVLVHGHTHIPELKRLAGGVVIFNPGSVSRPKRGLPASFGTYEDGGLRVLELESGEVMMELEL